MLRRLSFFPVLLLLIHCGSEVTNEPASSPTNPPKPEEGTTSTLDACSLPRPCAWPLSSGKPSEINGPRCVVSELSNGRALSVDTLLVGDGPSNGCEVHQELYFYATTSTAYSIWRKKCGTTEERRIRRCTMLSRDAYAACLGNMDATTTSSDGIKCSLPSDWMTGCTEVTTPACP